MQDGVARFWRDRRGQVMPLYVFIMIMGFFAAAALFDIGMLTLKRQELVEIAAMASQAGADRYDIAAWDGSNGQAAVLDHGAAYDTALGIATKQASSVGGVRPSIEKVEVTDRTVTVQVAVSQPGFISMITGNGVVRVSESASIGLTK